jgi:hypothetical protein
VGYDIASGGAMNGTPTRSGAINRAPTSQTGMYGRQVGARFIVPDRVGARFTAPEAAEPTPMVPDPGPGPFYAHIDE